jgi:hypothetical protein
MSGIASVKVDAGNCLPSTLETFRLYSRHCRLTSGRTYLWRLLDLGGTARGNAARFS